MSSKSSSAGSLHEEGNEVGMDGGSSSQMFWQTLHTRQQESNGLICLTKSLGAGFADLDVADIVRLSWRRGTCSLFFLSFFLALSSDSSPCLYAAAWRRRSFGNSCHNVHLECRYGLLCQ